ncbi:hypothetical protein [Tepidiforma sp.]|uniref:hypothetical protein n=1 Tax=Tepidiforma sp. TaxID=2682230 RepID=UPI002606A13C|nr:hypothetical protein [Tepidiforma sp.]MCX7619171.1 hypothetical protein [Tepidiforma sp.]
MAGLDHHHFTISILMGEPVWTRLQELFVTYFTLFSYILLKKKYIEKGEGRREKGEGRREKGEGRREKGKKKKE